jgi:hypothetical protein
MADEDDRQVGMSLLEALNHSVKVVDDQVVVTDLDALAARAAMPDMVRAGDHGSALDEELSDVLITSEMLAAAVREDDDVPGLRVLPDRHGYLRLATGKGLHLCAQRMLQSPDLTPRLGHGCYRARVPAPALAYIRAPRCPVRRATRR